MSTYLKNMARYKHNQLKNKSVDDIQKLFDKAMKRVNTFVDMDTKLVEASEVRAKEDKEIAELIEVAPDKEEVAIDALPLAPKPPSIMYLVFSHMLKSFDREDLETLWKLVKVKHGSTRLEEGYKIVLWGDLKTMFDPYVEDQVWRNQQDYRVIDWKLCDSCGVHSLRKLNFKEGDFPRLNLYDIEDMLLLLVQKKLSNLDVDDRYDLGVALRMFTRQIVILHRVQDLQLGVESYQKKLNITRPETTRSNISKLTPYTSHKNPQGIIYQDKYKRNRLMRSDKLYKFCDGTLSFVRCVLHDIASNLEMDYLPKRY
ncbi:hypothetical protein Tco_0431523 [Tanacetum coccineum]